MKNQVLLLIFVSFCEFSLSFPVVDNHDLKQETEEDTVPVDFVTTLAKTASTDPESDTLYGMPENPPVWLLRIITEVSETDHPNLTNRQKRQINISDPAVQEILRAYYLYCARHGGSGTMQIRLGRSLRRGIRRQSQTHSRSSKRSRRSVKGVSFQHLIKHPSFLKLLKSSLRLRGRNARSILSNPKVWRILHAYYSRQKGHGTMQTRFG